MPREPKTAEAIRDEIVWHGIDQREVCIAYELRVAAGSRLRYERVDGREKCCR